MSTNPAEFDMESPPCGARAELLDEAAHLGAYAAGTRFELSSSIQLFRIGAALAPPGPRAIAAARLGVTLLAKLTKHDGFALVQPFANFVGVPAAVHP